MVGERAEWRWPAVWGQRDSVADCGETMWTLHQPPTLTITTLLLLLLLNRGASRPLITSETMHTQRALRSGGLSRGEQRTKPPREHQS